MKHLTQQQSEIDSEYIRFQNTLTPQERWDYLLELDFPCIHSIDKYYFNKQKQSGTDTFDDILHRSFTSINDRANIKVNINIAKDYSDALGAEFICQGQYSGEDFYRKLLLPKYCEAASRNCYLYIDVSNTYGFPHTFLRGSFFLLLKKFGLDVRHRIKLVCTDDDKEFTITEINEWLCDKGN